MILENDGVLRQRIKEANGAAPKNFGTDRSMWYILSLIPTLLFPRNYFPKMI